MTVVSVPTGTKLGKYEVVKPLASGSLAELLLARTSPTERPRVLKWIRPEQAIDGAFIESFATAGQRAVQLHHPNIVEVHEVGREDGTHYLAIEYVHGDDLRKLLARLHERRAKLPVQHILAISTAVAQALQYAHDRPEGPVLHLGIKPANVIITAEGAVKVADFGIGRAALTEGRTDLLPAIAGYLSPEQCTGQPVDRRSDVFGLGILMYELATGRRLFKGDNELVTMATIVAGDIPAPTKHRGDLPKDLEAVIQKALARAPEDRFQTAHEVHAALDKFATKAGVRGSLTTLAGYTKRLFGVRPEPWLTDEDPGNAVSNEFDGAPNGIAVPPVEAVQACSLPSYVVAGDDSPIVRVKKRVSRDLPTEQLDLANLKAQAPDKPTPVKIPAPANGASARALPKPLPQRPAPLPVRVKPKTVQIPAHKEESTKVMGPRSTDDEVTSEKTDVLDTSEISFVGKHVLAEDDTVTAVTVVPGAPAPPKLPPPANGKPVLDSLAGLKDVSSKRDAAKRLDAERLPKPSVAGEIRQRPGSASRTATDVDEIASTITAVANPPPMVPASKHDATEHVVPLPIGERGSITSTDEVIVNAGKKKWFAIGGLLVATAAAAVIAIGFTGGLGSEDDAPAPVASTVDPPKVAPPPEPPKPDQPRTPRTPRNSHVTTDDPEPDIVAPVEPPPAPVEPAALAAPEVEEPPPPKQIEEPPPPKFVEPRDPSPPDDDPVAKPKPKPTKSKPAIAQKPKPKPAAKPKPKKPTTATAKPTGKWDPNALFPKK